MTQIHFSNLGDLMMGRAKNSSSSDTETALKLQCIKSLNIAEVLNDV